MALAVAALVFAGCASEAASPPETVSTQAPAAPTAVPTQVPPTPTTVPIPTAVPAQARSTPPPTPTEVPVVARPLEITPELVDLAHAFLMANDLDEGALGKACVSTANFGWRVQPAMEAKADAMQDTPVAGINFDVTAAMLDRDIKMIIAFQALRQTVWHFALTDDWRMGQVMEVTEGRGYGDLTDAEVAELDKRDVEQAANLLQPLCAKVWLASASG